MTLYRTARRIFSMGIVIRYRVALPLAFNPMVKLIQDDICQQWRNNAALRQLPPDPVRLRAGLPGDSQRGRRAKENSGKRIAALRLLF